MKKQRIAIINPFTFRLVRGIETMVLYLANTLVAQDFEVTLISEKAKNKTSQQVIPLDPRVEVLLAPTFRYYTHTTVVPWYVAFLSGRPIDRLITFFSGYGIDHAYKLASRWQYIPLYIYLGYSFSQAPHRYREFKDSGLDKLASGILAVSTLTARQAEDFFHRPVNLLPPGVDGIRLRPERTRGYALRTQLGIPIAAPVLLAAAAHEYGKGLHHVIDAMGMLTPHHSELHCIIAGDGKERSHLEQQVALLGLSDRCHFIGAREDMHIVYNTADIFCSLSTSEASITGLTTWEAMTSGVPAIFVSNDPDEEPNWQEGSIVLSEANPSVAAAMIDRLLKNPSERAKLATEGRKFILDRYEWHVVANKLTSLINLNTDE